MKSLVVAAGCFFVLVGFQVCADELEFNVSGYARLVAGAIDDSRATFKGYGDSVSLSEQSLAALQIETKLSSQFSITTQLLLHSETGRHNGIEWLYASFQPNKSWRFDLGRMRAPLYQYSNVIDVGYSYPWITAPHQVYGSFLFDSFDGVKASYNLTARAFSADVEAYYGEFEDEVGAVGGITHAKARDFHGLVLNLSINDLKVRASYHDGVADYFNDRLANFQNVLRQTHYTRTAESLSTHGKASAMQLGLEYNKLDYFIKAELVKINTSTLLFPNINGFYATYGYVFYPFMLHVTYASSHFSYRSPVREIPMGLSPQLDNLALSYQALINREFNSQVHHSLIQAALRNSLNTTAGCR